MSGAAATTPASHEGSMTTIHANSAIDGLTRMESMVLHSGTQLPRSLIQQNIATTIQFVIHADLGPDGKRRLDEILEIRGWDNGNYVTAPIFKWNPKDGLVSTGKIPQIAGEKPVPGESLFVLVHQRRLSRRRDSLLLRNHDRLTRKPQTVHAGRDRAGTHQNHLDLTLHQLGDLRDQALEAGGMQPGAFLGQDGAADLDDDPLFIF